ncbi:MAG: hypothetical protein NT175_08055 [Bacteroidetes bacterium]|nr:hypothetical protein [Bacteroidota bacterium]
MSNHYYHGKGFRLSLTSNVFLSARLAEDGILKKYLVENCGKVSSINSILCDSIELLPTSFNDFLWAKKSYLGGIGYPMPQWEKADSIFAPVVRDILTTPRYLKLYIWEDIKGTCRQLFSLGLGCGVDSYRENSAPYYPIKHHLKNEIDEFMNTRQSWGMLKFNTSDLINYFTLGFSVIIIFWACYNRKISDRMILLIIICGLGYLYNAAVTSSLADVSNRFQPRVAWLVDLIAMIIIYLRLLRIKDQLSSKPHDQSENL